MWQPNGPPSVIAALRAFYRAVAADVRRSLDLDGPDTGRRWRRPPRTCPDWCAQDHTCTARLGAPMAEHRSPPHTFRLPWGSLTATRVAGLARRPHLEMRVTVTIADDDPAHALDQSMYLPAAVADAVRATLGQLAERHRPALPAAGAALPAGPRHETFTAPPGATRWRH